MTLVRCDCGISCTRLSPVFIMNPFATPKPIFCGFHHNQNATDKRWKRWRRRRNKKEIVTITRVSSISVHLTLTLVISVNVQKWNNKSHQARTTGNSLHILCWRNGLNATNRNVISIWTQPTRNWMRMEWNESDSTLFLVLIYFHVIRIAVGNSVRFESANALNFATLAHNNIHLASWVSWTLCNIHLILTKRTNMPLDVRQQ